MTIESIAAEIVDRIDGNPDCKLNKAEAVANVLRQFLKEVVPSCPNAEVSEGGTRDSRIETAAQSRPSLH
jgi:hypothetical protein